MRKLGDKFGEEATTPQSKDYILTLVMSHCFMEKYNTSVIYV